MDAVREIYKLLRWRLIAVRYVRKIASFISSPALPQPARLRNSAFERQGFGPGPSIPALDLEEMRAIYGPRAELVVPTAHGHPFENLMRAEDLTASNPVLRFAFSPAVLDAAHDYFGERFKFDSIQLMYSYPTDGELRESQKWHRDYGDSKSFHCVAYVNDVLAPEDGPFVFVDRNDASRIIRSPIIRRIDDAKFRRELGNGEIRTFYGKAGESVLVDPAACYHYGSRCKRGRLALFVTFNTDRPYVAAQALLRENRSRLLAAAQQIRPDLSPIFLKQILSV